MPRANPEREREYQKQYYQKNKTSIQEKRRVRLQQSGYQREYYRRNLDKMRAYQRKRRKNEVHSTESKIRVNERRRIYYHRVVKVRQNLKYLQSLKDQPVVTEPIKKVFVIV
jgi:hypothetical protein